VIGYLSVDSINGKHVGGIIIVDDAGIPLEFKYTDPIVPTQLQRIIYGRSLERYLNIEIIAKTLISKLENKPSVIFTDKMELIEAGDNVFFISKTAEGEAKPEEGEYIIEGLGAIYRLVGSSQISEDALEKLKEASQKISLIEPFQRLHKALEYVCSER